MTKNELITLVRELAFDSMTPIFDYDNFTLSIFRPSKLSARFKHYDVNTNFQIFIYEKEKNIEYRPNHLRLLIDLKLRVRENPNARDLLLKAFDDIFYGADPSDAINIIKHIPFSQYLMPIELSAALAQIFLIEQEVGFRGKSNYNPTSLYLQGWIRTFINDESEIDSIIYRIVRGTPPAKKYTCKDDKNSSQYQPLPSSLWYKNR